MSENMKIDHRIISNFVISLNRVNYRMDRHDIDNDKFQEGNFDLDFKNVDVYGQATEEQVADYA